MIVGLHRMEQYYTKEQVSEKLGVAQSTVYVLAKKKLIDVEVLPQGVSRTKRYTKSSVDAYTNRQAIEKNGLTVAEFATHQQVSPQRVYQLIKKLAIHLEKAKIGKRKCLLLSMEHQQLLLQELQHKKHKGTTTDFYRFAEDIALFQLFQDRDQIAHRVMRNEAGEWGFLSPTFLPFEQAISERLLQRAYDIHQPRLIANIYADFSFPIEDARMYEMMDLLYEVVGIENMHVYLHDQSVEVSVKALAYDISDKRIGIDYLNEHCLNAVITLSEAELRIQAKDKSVTVVLEADVYEAVKREKSIQNHSLTEVINRVLREKLL